MEELSTIALAEFDTLSRFKAMSVAGDPQEGLRLLEKLDLLTAQPNARNESLS